VIGIHCWAGPQGGSLRKGEEEEIIWLFGIGGEKNGSKVYWEGFDSKAKSRMSTTGGELVSYRRGGKIRPGDSDDRKGGKIGATNVRAPNSPKLRPKN